MKDKTQMHFNVNHALLNSNMHKDLKVFKTLMWCIVIIGWKTCHLGLICNWFNQNIKYLSNVKFEIKSQNLNMFQLHTKMQNFIIKIIFAINLHG
jgi:hypothetical protein